ncbi:DUF3486 family protein [Limnohabitans sp.]|uniref:DUF3486 family protein n=1 Tax=Limnohabitans sp. TaxID=1907725 RepID=UPI00286F96A3|nr:DUF3486 family protein [Limnohabitans sp.]
MPPRSKIAQLPEEFRAWLHRALVERAFGDIIPLTQELNDKLKEAGIAVYVGKSAVGAESQKVQRAQEALRATIEAARIMNETAGNEGDKLGGATMSMVQGQIFELALQVREMQDEEDPSAKIDLLNKVALASSRLSRASVNQDRWRAEVDKQIKAAADTATKLARAGGLSPKTVKEIRQSILGISTARSVSEAQQHG